VELIVTCETLEFFLDCRKNAGDLFGWAFAICGGKHPYRDRRYGELNAPVEQVVQLIGACHVDGVWIIQVVLAAESSIAIQDQPDVAGTGKDRTWRSRRRS
jgi:hypothetical protein